MYSSMPDTTSTSSPYRSSVLRLFGASMMFLAALLLATSVGSAQDSGDVNCSDFSTQPEAQRFYENNNPDEDPFFLDADNDGEACEELPGGEEDNVTPSKDDEDSSVSGSQYEDDDQQPVQTPQTGGPDLLLIAAGLVSVLGAAGLALSYRRR